MSACEHRSEEPKKQERKATIEAAIDSSANRCRRDGQGSISHLRLVDQCTQFGIAVDWYDNGSIIGF